MGLINRLHTFATMPGISPDIGSKIDQELNTVFNAVNGNLDDANIDGSPAIQSSKLSLGGAGFLPLAGGSLSAALNHAFEGIWRSMGLVGTSGLVREYRSLSGGNIVWGIAYNTFYDGGWQGRDISDICLRVELTKTSDGWGGLRVYTADSLGGGVPPTWNYAQHYAPMGGTGELGDVTATTETNKSGIFNYNNLTIPSGVTWTLEQGKPLIIFARESVTINGTIDGNGMGASGGGSVASANGLVGAQATGGGTGGGGGGNVSVYPGGAGGVSWHGNKALGGVGGVPNGAGGAGNTAPSASLVLCINATGVVVGGSGGGSGGAGASGSGAGGTGGGYVYIEAPVISIGSSGTITCNGSNGGNGAGASGSGGGGGGGVIHIRSKSYNNANTTPPSVISGNGGTTNEVGGNGGAGVIYIEEYK